MNPEPEIRQISIADLLSKKAEKAAILLIDVREPDEVAKGMIPGAKNIPKGVISEKIRAVEHHDQSEIIIYCGGGSRSIAAAKTLQQLGYNRVFSLTGGYRQWVKNQEPASQLTPSQTERYQRHLLLPQVGESGQIKLLKAKVAIIGVGGLGCPAALYCAAAGVGTLGLIDDDLVDLSNLQRQILHGQGTLKHPKVDSAEGRLKDLNPEVKINKHPVRLSSFNARDILQNYDLVINGSDNFPTRYLVNDVCYFLKKPLVDGAIYRFEGQASVFIADQGPCYRCLYPDPPQPGAIPSCQEAGVLGVLPGIIGSIQAVEAIKLILGLGESLVGRLLLFDAQILKFRELKLKRDPQCPLCGENPRIRDLSDDAANYGNTCHNP